ncbi:MAG: ATP-binding protein [Fibrobacteres bacterium]|jgi:predicted AAA+ superfamily ATPase|nr:ATP-binding protein [Fibrobacterota bacterium]
METVSRFLTPPDQSFFLFGPRGTGKSTWIHEHFGEKILYLDLLRMDLFRSLTANPEKLRELVAGSPGTDTVVLDEIQKAPALLDEVHSLMESHKRIRFIMTGSSARKLKRAGVDLLAGRALVRNLHPFMAAELGKKFVLEKALKSGLVPLVMNAKDPEGTLSSYAALYLKEEVQAEGLVRNIGSFARFLEAISFSHGSILNLSHVARECQVGQKTAEGYLEVLEDLMLGHRLPIFQKRSKRALASHPKFYYFDTGVFRSLRPTGPLDDPGMVEGAALEGMVFQHLRAWIGYSGDKHSLSYWRTRAGTEVDFIVYGKDGMHAFEVKNSKRIRPEDFSGLISIGEEYPIAKRYLLHQGAERFIHDGIRCIPCGRFLAELRPGKPIPD